MIIREIEEEDKDKKEEKKKKGNEEKKQEEQERKNKTIENGVQALLRNELIKNFRIHKANGEITLLDIGISVAVLLGTIFLLYKYGLRVYKVGILNYSSSNLWKKIFNALKQRD